MNGECIPCPAPWARTIAMRESQDFGFKRSGANSNLISPERPPLRIEADRLESALDGGISGVNLSADSADSSLLRVRKKRCDQTTANAFAPPLRRNKQSNDIHRLAAKLGT